MINICSCNTCDDYLNLILTEANIRNGSLVGIFQIRLKGYVTYGIRALSSNIADYGPIHLCKIGIRDLN